MLLCVINEGVEVHCQSMLCALCLLRDLHFFTAKKKMYVDKTVQCRD